MHFQSDTRRRTGALPVAVATLGVGCILVLLSMPITRGWRDRVSPLDEGMGLVYAERLLEGDVQGAQFDTTFPPGTTVLVAASYLLIEPSVAAERLVGVTMMVAVVAATALMLRSRGWASAILGALIMAIVAVDDPIFVTPIGMAVPLLACTVAAVLTASRLNGRPRSLAFASAGLLAGFTVATRVDMTPAMAALTALVWIDARPHRRTFLAAAAVGLLPLAVQLIAAGPVTFVRKLVYEPLFVWGQYRHRTITGAATEQQVQLAVAVVIALAIATWAILRMRDRRGDDRLVAVAAVMALPAIPYALQRFSGGNLAAAHRMLLPAVLVIGADLAVRRGWRPSIGVALGALVFLGALVPTGVDNGIADAVRWPTLVRDKTVVVTSEHDRGVYVPYFTAPALQLVVDELDRRAEAGDRLVVGTRDPRRVYIVDTYLYHLFPHLEPATYYLEFNPGVVNARSSRYADDLRTADFLILNLRYDAHPEVELQPYGPDEPIRVVEDEFDEVLVSGSFSLFQRKSYGRSG